MLLHRILSVSLLLLATSMAHSASPSVLVVGDSLCAGYGIQVEQGWVNLLQQSAALTKKVKLINACVSGETSSGGLTRLPALLATHKPQIVILELGGNDALRGQPLNTLRDNLQNLINISAAAGAKVLLVGMQIPTNYGPRYTREFRAIYPALADKNKLSLVPFLLENVALHPELFQADGIHPTAAAQPIIVNNVLPALLAMLP